MIRKSAVVAIVVADCWGVGSSVNGGTKCGPDVSDAEIKIGQTMPYSGPLSAARGGRRCRLSILNQSFVSARAFDGCCPDPVTEVAPLGY